MLKKNNKLSGFTLIEVVIVIFIIGLFLTTLFSMFFLIIKSQARLVYLNEVKKNGDYLLNYLKYFLKNDVVKISSIGYNQEDCNFNDKDKIYTISKSNSGHSFFLNSNNAIQENAIDVDGVYVPQETFPLNSFKTRIKNLKFSCSQNNIHAPPLITVGFSIEYNYNNTIFESISLNYRTNIKLTNY